MQTQVQFTDGGVLEANDLKRAFDCSRDWAEWAWRAHGLHGLVRGPDDTDWNTPQSVLIDKQHGPGQFTLLVQRLRATTPAGQAIEIDEPIRCSLTTARVVRTSLPVFVRPVFEQVKDSLEAQPLARRIVEARAELSGPDPSYLQIGRLRPSSDAGRVELDPGFMAPCIWTHSSAQLSDEIQGLDVKLTKLEGDVLRALAAMLRSVSAAPQLLGLELLRVVHAEIRALRFRLSSRFVLVADAFSSARKAIDGMHSAITAFSPEAGPATNGRSAVVVDSMDLASVVRDLHAQIDEIQDRIGPVMNIPFSNEVRHEPLEIGLNGNYRTILFRFAPRPLAAQFRRSDVAKLELSFRYDEQVAWGGEINVRMATRENAGPGEECFLNEMARIGPDGWVRLAFDPAPSLMASNTLKVMLNRSSISKIVLRQILER